MTDPAVRRLAIWSGPRNISTALMRSWENRPDTDVVDEPLYAAYLDMTGLDHPGRAEIITTGETDWRAVVGELVDGTHPGRSVYYQKHMAHHLLPTMATDWVERLHNVLLIRDPRAVAASYAQARADVTAADLGVPQQVALYEQLSRAGQRPAIIDAADFLQAPEAYSRWLCAEIGVDFLPEMLNWPAGPRPSDGCWARHWYAAVEASTGFAPYRPRAVELSGAPARAAADCQPGYRRLYGDRVRL
jgi:hypothetical protein